MTRLRAPDEADFGSRLRSAAVAARVGLWLGICFGICFVTGLVSHWSQLALPPVPVPTSPSWGYRLTQGLHVVTGTAAIPLLLVKLWAVYPKLFERPPRGSARRLAVHGAERVSIGVLVAAGIFQLVTGLANSAQWYPWSFSFRSTHYAVAWVAIGALVVHIAVKLPVIRQALGADVEDGGLDRDSVAPASRGLSRRGLLRATWAAAGVAVVATAGNTVGWLRDVSVLAVRSGEGPQGVPINKSAVAARVTDAARDPAYRLTVAYAGRELDLSRDELAGMEQATEELPIACVEGWSASGSWRGVRVRDLLALVGCAGRQRRRGDVAAAERPVPRDHAARELRRRPAVAAGAGAGRGAARHRPRLPVPDRRAQPARRAADQVGTPAGGARMTRILLAIAGVAAAAYGVWLLSDDSFADLRDVADLAGRRRRPARPGARPGRHPARRGRVPAAPRPVAGAGRCGVRGARLGDPARDPGPGPVRRPAGQPRPCSTGTTSPGGRWSRR